jgi:hypothetical protein
MSYCKQSLLVNLRLIPFTFSGWSMENFFSWIYFATDQALGISAGVSAMPPTMQRVRRLCSTIIHKVSTGVDVMILKYFRRKKFWRKNRCFGAKLLLVWGNMGYQHCFTKNAKFSPIVGKNRRN